MIKSFFSRGKFKLQEIKQLNSRQHLLETLEPRLQFAALTLGAWNFSLPSTTAAATASISATINNNDIGGESGSLDLSLLLSTVPYGQNGTEYTVAEASGLDPLQGGASANYTASATLDPSTITAGTYYVLAQVSEFRGDSYVVVDGGTAAQTYTVGDVTNPGPVTQTGGLTIGTFTFSIPSSSGTATVSANVTNSNPTDTVSGATSLALQLSDKPYGQQGTIYTAATQDGLASITGQASQMLTASSSLDPSTVPAGTYYVIAQLSEFVNGSYVVESGATAGTQFVVSAATKPPAGGPDFVVSKVVSPVVAQVTGAVIKPKFSLANIGVGTYRGPLTIDFYLSPDGSGIAGAYPVAAMTKNVKLRVGAAPSLMNYKFALPSTVPNGDYYLLVDADPQHATTDTATSNNIAASPAPFALAVAFSDFSTALTSGVTVGRKFLTLTLKFTNLGNVKAIGALEIVLTSPQLPGVTVFDKSYKVNYKPGQSKTLKIQFLPGTLPAGSELDGLVNAADVNPADSDPQGKSFTAIYS